MTDYLEHLDDYVCTQGLPVCFIFSFPALFKKCLFPSPFEKMTYRMMSSIMGVSSNTAKEMLAEFKRTRKTSVHCCYAICGYLKHGENTMENNTSTMENNTMDQQFIITVVKEELFPKRKNDFARITSLHIYSVEPTNLPNDLSSTLWMAESSKFKALLSHEDPESENYLK